MIWRVDVFIGSAIWAEIHVFVRVVAVTMTVWHARRGVMEWSVIAGRAREDGTEFSDAGKDVGRDGRRRFCGAVGRLCMMVMKVMSLRSEDLLVVNGGATPARRLARRAAIALFTLVTSTAARRRFTL